MAIALVLVAFVVVLGVFLGLVLVILGVLIYETRIQRITVLARQIFVSKKLSWLEKLKGRGVLLKRDKQLSLHLKSLPSDIIVYRGLTRLFCFGDKIMSCQHVCLVNITLSW